ncbi:hypothetical protein [Marinimicrobium sp. LS-A18]|uniref:hypothetical protein n=1 Tax=Marinimicrobium sp. LS-A18 TaxID=1381596 RepID=UPI000467E20B|nr:hypothetical protein [Marinimicrobium sp. LS-A18]
MKGLFLTLIFLATAAAADPNGRSDASWIFVLTAHNADGAIVAVDTEGPFASEEECKAVGAVVTKRVYEVIGSFQPETHSAMEWDKLTTSCEDATRS